MIDKAKIFTDIVKKNALRREVGLPEWPVRQTYDSDLRGALRREYFEHHADQALAEVLGRQRAKYGADFPMSAGGRQVIALLVHKMLQEGFVRNDPRIGEIENRDGARRDVPGEAESARCMSDD